MVAAVLPTDARTSMPSESADDVYFAVSHKPIRNQTNRRSSVAQRVHSGEARPVAVPGCVDRAGVSAASSGVQAVFGSSSRRSSDMRHPPINGLIRLPIVLILSVTFNHNQPFFITA